MTTRRFSLVALCLSFLLISTPLAWADCYDTTQWGARGNIRDIAVTGEQLYVADGRGIALWDVANPQVPREIATAASSAPSSRVAMSGSGPLLLTTNALELRAPGTLQLLSSRATDATMLTAAGSFAVTAKDSVTLWRINGSQLTILGTLVPSDTPRAIFLDGTTLYVGEAGSIEVFDVSHGTLSLFTTLGAAATSFAKSGHFLYAVAAGSITTIDTTASPLIVSRLSRPENIYQRVSVADGFLWAGDATGVDKFSLADPVHPQFLGRTNGSEAITAAGDRLYVIPLLDDFGQPAESQVSLQILSTDLAELGAIHGAAGPLGGVATDGHYAYVADGPYFRVLDISSGRPEEVASLPLGDYSDRIMLTGTIAVAYGRGNVHLIDISTPYAPVELGVHHTGGRPVNGVTMAGPYLLAADAISGMHVLDISDPTHPYQIGSFYNDQTGRFTGTIAAIPGAVYIVADSRVRIVDLTNPRHPLNVKFFTLEAKQLLTSVDNPTGRKLLFAVSTSAFNIYDLASPFNPVLLSSIPISPGPMAISGTDAYIASSTGDLQHVSFANPLNPVLVSTDHVFRSPTQIAVTPDGIIAAEQYYLTLAHRSSGEVPHLSVTIPATGTAYLSWTGPDTRYSVELSTSPDFSNSTAGVVSGHEMFLAPLQKTWARVRAISTCSTATSNIVLIDPSTAPALRFIGSSLIVPVTPGHPVTVNAVVANEGESAATVTIESSGIVDGGPAVSIPGHSHVVIPVTIDTTGVTTRTSVPLTAAGVAGPFTVTLVPVSTTTATVRSDGILLPGIGAVPGANQTNWASDVTLSCRRGPCDVTLSFAPFGSGTQATQSTLSMQEGESLILRDIVRSTFGLSDTAGVLRVASTGELSASANTFNDSSSGRFGQLIPAAPDHFPSVQVMPGIRQDNLVRTNVGFMDLSGHGANVSVILYDSSGTLLVFTSFGLAPFERLQESVSALVNQQTIPAGAWLRIESSTPVAAWSSRVDQKTGDGVFNYGSAPTSTVAPSYDLVMPVAGSTSGAYNTSWRTGLELVNPAATAAAVELTFIGASGSPTATVLANIPGRGSLSIDDFSSYFAPNVDLSLGSVLIHSNLPLVGWGRVYNQTPDGTYGQQVPLVVPGTAPTSSSIAGLAQSASRRTNAGVTETQGRAVTVRLSLYDSSGHFIGATERTLAPHELLSLVGVLQMFGADGLEGARMDVDVVDGSGSAVAWVSIAERSTGDGVFVISE